MKLIPLYRAKKAHYTKIDAIVSEGVIIGTVEFAYGRSDTSDTWSVWDIAVHLPLTNDHFHADPFYFHHSNYMTYTKCCYSVLKNINHMLRRCNLWQCWQPTSEVYTAEGTYVELTQSVIMGRSTPVETPHIFKGLRYPLAAGLEIDHDNMRIIKDM